jgi:hypothetical protein
VVTKERTIDLFYPMKKKDKLQRQPLNTDDELKKLGERIKHLRIKSGYTSYEYFAYEHNISRAQFGRYEQGQDLRFSSLIRVIDALGISIQDFFNEGFD